MGGKIGKQEEYMRLAPPRKKGILRLVFSRLFLILVLLGVQIFIIVMIYGKLEEKLPFNAGQFRVVIVFIMLCALFNSEMDSSAKLTWMLIITLFPFVGAVFYAFTQTELFHRSLQKRLEWMHMETDDCLVHSREVLDKIEKERTGLDDLSRYISRTGSFPIYENTEVKYFPCGEEMFEPLLAELKKAEKYIFMEYFIIEEGFMWGKILEILAEKVKAGVEVRVMYDGMCEMSVLPNNYPELMKGLGIKCKPFSRIYPVVSTYYNYRDHRKILSIDGKVAFTGGINLADEYINKISRFGYWKDTAVMLKGPAAISFTHMFMQMWAVTESNIDKIRDDFKRIIAIKPDFDIKAKGYVMPYGDSPLDGQKVGESIYMDILNRATDYVHIMTPYLILDDEMKSAICFAAERGVDVKIILPGIPDKKAAYSLAKSHYRKLVKSGVRIYEFTPGFVHAKVFVSDNEKAVVGSINLDYRSLYHHFECAAFIYGNEAINDIEADFKATLLQCREVTRTSIKNEKLGYKVLGSIMRFIAPLM